MSVMKEVCAALLASPEAMTRDSLGEVTGCAYDNISEALSRLVKAGDVSRNINTEGGKHTYEASNEAELRRRAGDAAPDAPSAESDAQPVPRRGSKQRKTRAVAKSKRRGRAPTTLHALVPAQASVPRTSTPSPLSFFIDEVGSIVIMRGDGAGGMTTITRPDSIRLAKFLQRYMLTSEAA